MYLFNIFNESKITTILTGLAKEPVFSKKNWFLKTIKTSHVPSNSILSCRKYLIIQIKNRL